MDRQAAVNWTGFLIAAANTLVLYFICFGLFYRQFTPEIKDPVMLALGVILAKHGDIIAWAFGSSSQSKKQSETIDKLADTTHAATNAALPAKPAVKLPPGEQVTVAAEGDGAP